MSAYDNVVVGKLNLKGKALDVKVAGIKKKKKKNKNKNLYDGFFKGMGCDFSKGGDALLYSNKAKDENDNGNDDDEGQAKYDHHLTPAERRYLEHLEKLDHQRLAKIASKSHRDRVQEFNQYLANILVSIMTFLKWDLANKLSLFLSFPVLVEFQSLDLQCWSKKKKDMQCCT